MNLLKHAPILGVLATLFLSGSGGPDSEAVSYTQLFDLSGSTSASNRQAACQAADGLAWRIALGSLGRIGQFRECAAPTVTWLTDRTPYVQGGVVEACTNIPSGATALYDAVIEACNELGTAPAPRKLVVYTDMGENCSTADVGDVFNAAVAHDVTAGFIRYTPTAPAVNADGASDPDAVQMELEGAGFPVFVVTSVDEVYAALCEIVPCRPLPSPALSPWGTAVLALLLIVTAVIMVNRRGAATG